MFYAKSGKILGEMVARPETIRDPFFHFSPNARQYDSFYIQRLRAYERNKGVGTAFINLAKKESLRNFCSGNIHLIARNCLDVKDNPFIFYRKMGFSFNKYHQKTQEYVDECIKRGIPAEIKNCGYELPMYIEKCVINQKENIEKMYKLKISFPTIFYNL